MVLKFRILSRGESVRLDRYIYENVHVAVYEDADGFTIELYCGDIDNTIAGEYVSKSYYQGLSETYECLVEAVGGELIDDGEIADER